MPRLPRLNPVGVPLHIIQRGNNRQVCFNNDVDMAVYANWLYDYSVKYDVHIHAWGFMTNHVHLLVTPWQDNGVSRMMQSLGRYYVRYFNQKYRRSGTLWEGRFKSSLVESSDYLLRCYQYNEIRLSVNQGLVFGSEQFKDEIQANLQRRVRLKKPGPGRK